MRHGLARLELVVAPVPVDANGFDLTLAVGLHGEARGAFVMPSRHFPLGVVLPIARPLPA